MIGHEGHDELAAGDRDNCDGNDGGYNCAYSIYDDSAGNSYVHDSDDKDDCDAWVDEDWQLQLTIKKAKQPKRI